VWLLTLECAGAAEVVAGVVLEVEVKPELTGPLLLVVDAGLVLVDCDT
jgi:hypothetical protein